MRPRNKGWLSKVPNSGIWLQPITLVLITLWLGDGWKEQVGTCLLLSFIPVLLFFVFSESSNPKEDIEKPKAMYPEVPTELLKSMPVDGDIILGKSKGKYVCRNVADDGHYLIIGGSGSGKSSCLIIPTLLCNGSTPVFAIDIKGELSAKAAKAGSKNIRIFNPQDTSAWGYNPLFALNKDSTEQEKYETMQSIAFSLIALPAGIKYPFWKSSARNLLIGLLLYFYRQGKHDLVAIADEILGKPIAQTIETAMQTAVPTDIEYKYLVQFSDMAEDTLSGIFAELANALTIFATDSDIRKSLGGNSRKITPQMLEEGLSIYLVIRAEKLSAYYNLLQLIINQTLGTLEKRPENSAPILFVADELPRILSAGKIERLLDASRTLRSRRVRLMLVTQSLAALMSAELSLWRVFGVTISVP